ncbi:MAG: aminopeptidase [Xanthomonadales bacterium]|nr:aminopeptidase [Xanthomonadales bacterium]
MILRLLLVLCLGACSAPGYYLQAMSGQKKLMQSRQDIQILLDDPETPAELAGRLKTAEQIKTFAQNELGLPIDGSYSSYVEVEGTALVWNVVATKEFSLEPKKWCFPVAGCVPYRGFFKEQKAQGSADRLRNRGMDVIVSPAAAYSSLGWFSDPLLSTMFSGSDTRLAAYLFHELAHQRLYIKNDGLFNEGYANFVEETGVKAWLKLNEQQDELDKWLQLQKVSKDFSRLVGKTRIQLTGLYRSSQADTAMRQKKAEIFSAFRDDYQRLSDEKWQGKPYYSAWFQEPLNNARFALYNTYEGSLCAFQGLWNKSAGDWQKFHQLAEQKSGLPKDERQQWLKQTCSGIAPQTNL